MSGAMFPLFGKELKGFRPVPALAETRLQMYTFSSKDDPDKCKRKKLLQKPGTVPSILRTGVVAGSGLKDP